MSKKEKKVLVIDDEDFIRELIKDFLELSGVRCASAETAVQGLKLMAEDNFDLILLDRNLGKMKAEDLIAQIRKHKKDVPLVILTGDQQCSDDYLKEIGADGIIFKPFQVNDFMESIKKFLEIE
ncbi:MAG: response regulator [Candidatus Aminicenantes bacterium]|nr:MAG: response regulator [Candidatus Aminicenantes bacterium]